MRPDTSKGSVSPSVVCRPPTSALLEDSLAHPSPLLLLPRQPVLCSLFCTLFENLSLPSGGRRRNAQEPS